MKKTAKDDILEDKNLVFNIFNCLSPYELTQVRRVSKIFKQFSTMFATDYSRSGQYLNQVAINVNLQQDILLNSEISLQKLVSIVQELPKYIYENHSSEFVTYIAIRTLLPVIPQNTSWVYFNAMIKSFSMATDLKYIAVGGFIYITGSYLYRKGLVHIQARKVSQRINELKGYMNDIFLKLHTSREREEKKAELPESQVKKTS